MCLPIHWRSANRFHSTGISTIKHIQNIINAQESNGAASIQDPIVPAIKGEPQGRGTWKCFHSWTQDLVQWWNPFSVGYLNKQNWCHWVTENSHLSVVSPLHPQKFMMWCAMSSKRLIGPIFIDGIGTEMKYRKLLEHHFDPEVGSLNMTSRYCFMQDGTCPQRTSDIFTWVETKFNIW